jgi:predicted GNAT family N-acyltransferase
VNVLKNNDIDLKQGQLIKIFSLINNEWPNHEKTIVERVADIMKNVSSVKNKGCTRFTVWDGKNCVAHASIFSRKIFAPSSELIVRGLGDVCVSPNRRGEGLGRLIVSSVFKVIDKNDSQPTLFQTAIPEFYEKLGAKKILNKFYNSKNHLNVNSNPFWDENIMIYPSGFNFPDGYIDLNGNGF